MKKFFVIAVFMITATSAFALSKDSSYREARKSGALAKIKIHIVDDLGHDVSNADISVFFGMNFRPNGYYLKGVTDTNGMFIAEGETCGDEILIDVRKHGFYNSVKKLCFAKMGAEHKVKDNKWLPFNEIEKITLRKIEKPITLTAFNKLIDVAYTNKWIGFDMENKDFINPFGCGKNKDFEIKVEWDGLPAWKSKSCSMDVRFMQAETGGLYVNNLLESEFPYIYRAQPDAIYGQRFIRIVNRNGDPYVTAIPFAQDSALVTRTRCVIDANGKVKAANFGCIRRLEISPSRRGVALLRLSYIFNPTPNDTNLEPKR